MKKNLLLVLGLCCLLAACKKEEDPAPTNNNNSNNNTNNTNAMNGNWKGTVYDGAAVTAPQDVKYNATATSATAGTVKFDITFDGSTHKTEDAGYTLGANSATVTFTKTAGDFSVLSGGGVWVISKMDASALEMTSANGLIMKFSK
jgi:hypothetical protein